MRPRVSSTSTISNMTNRLPSSGDWSPLIPLIRTFKITWRRLSCIARCFAAARSRVNSSAERIHLSGVRSLAQATRRQKEFDSAIKRAMDISQARLDKNQNDVPALYALGVSHGLRANYNFLVRKAWMDSLKDATAARKAHNRVVELEPGHISTLSSCRVYTTTSSAVCRFI